MWHLVYNSTYEEYVDVDQDYTIKLHDKLNLVVEEPVEVLPSTSSTPLPATPQTAVSLPALCTGLATAYTLPEPTIDLKEMIAKAEKGKASNQLRHRIIRWLHADLFKYDLYPAKRDLYSEAARHLVFKYRPLGDLHAVAFGLMFLYSLKARTKNQRKRMADIREVAEERAKWAKVARSTSRTTARGLTQRCVATTLSSYAIGEDEASIEAHTEFLKKEMRKPAETRNQAMILDAMDRTFSKRREWILEKPRTVDEVLEMYPTLDLKEEVLNECFRITGIHVEVEVTKFFESKGDLKRISYYI
ncbi:uncharacterized protein LOC115330582 [Ixodes scapularis]|uniref:uncharacterized protein LOC115330582 n=1 Tax=Ixodes scapularis TaxID=6945 RepID=UPI001A9FA11B|nr:uncharacterized protein LOC115330582 [Ixodes scapularis]